MSQRKLKSLGCVLKKRKLYGKRLILLKFWM